MIWRSDDESHVFIIFTTSIVSTNSFCETVIENLDTEDDDYNSNENEDI